MAHFLCHLGCSHFGALLLDFYFTENSEPLECLDTQDIVSSSTVGSDIKKLEKTFCYKLKGQIKDKNRGLIDVCGFIVHINQQEIPNDIENGMYIEFTTSRIDLW